MHKFNVVNYYRNGVNICVDKESTKYGLKYILFVDYIKITESYDYELIERILNSLETLANNRN